MTHLSLNGRRGTGILSRWAGRALAVVPALLLGLAVLPAAARAQTGTVTGRVIETGAGPISGAQVSVQGTNLGVTTDADGRFTLVVPAGQRVLRVLAIGFKVGQVTVTVTPGGSSAANAELTRSVLSLDEVVVTGTGGEASKRELGNSISSINMAAEVKDPPASMDQLLQARTAGLSVTQTGAAVGAGAQIRLRGTVSVSQSNQPLIYVDGIRVRSEAFARAEPPAAADYQGRGNNIQESPLNDINPADIDRIEIIKGAAAATLYGTEASAGVIQIFTKKGTRGSKPRWNVEVGQGEAQLRPFGPWFNPYLNLKPRDSVVVNNGVVEASTDPGAVATSQSQGQCYPTPPTDGSGNPMPCDWVRNGYRQHYSGSVTGGFDQFQYFASGTLENNDGILPQDNEKRMSTRSNFSFDVSDKVRLEWNTAYTRDQLRNTPSGNNAQGLVLNVYRWERNYRSSSNPIVIDSLLNQSVTSDINHLTTGGSGYYTPYPWFTNRFTIGYDFAQQENRGLRPFGFVGAPLGRIYDAQNKYTTLTFDYSGNVDYNMTSTFKGTLSFGGQSVTNQFALLNAYSQDFAGPSDPTVTSGATYVSEENRQRVVNAGFFFQNVFKLKERYFLTGGVRVDGNSAFGTGLGLQAYPKVSLSYVLSDEPFWPRSIGEAKLRAALGYAGRAPGVFDKVKTWSPVNHVGIPAFIPNNIGDTLVGPERTKELELGADLGLLGSRLSVEATYYNRKTFDALFNVRQVPSLGFLTSRRSNVGSMASSGFELTTNMRVLDANKWGWEVGGSVYTNHSKVLDLGGAVAFAANGGWVQGPDTLSDGAVIYFPVLGIDGYKVKNKDAFAAPDSACVMGTTGAEWAAGGKQLCASNGHTVFGPQQPTLILGATTTLRMPGNITLSARGEYQGGAYIQDGASFNALQRSVLWPTCVRANGVLAQGGTVSDLTAFERVTCIASATNSFFMVFKQDFFKLRDLTLSVPLGKLLPQTESATLKASVQNFWRWYNKDLQMFDPETGSDLSLNEGRSITEHVPPPATLSLSLRVTF
jgi:TonB-linked SusC/RagA family outer membrane protein